MLNYPDPVYVTHVSTHLPEILEQSPDRRAELNRLRPQVEPLLLMDLGRIQSDLDGLLPRRTGGRPPWDRRALFRSLMLCVSLGGGRINAWVKKVDESPILRVMIGADPARPGPSVGTYYRFAAQVLRSSDVRADGAPGSRHAEIEGGTGGVFLRTLGKPPTQKQARDAKQQPSEGACEDMRLLLAQKGELSEKEWLEVRLMKWVARISLPLMADAGLLPQNLWLIIDGTVTRSQGSKKPSRLLSVADAPVTETEDDRKQPDQVGDESAPSVTDSSWTEAASSSSDAPDSEPRQRKRRHRRGTKPLRVPKKKLKAAPEKPAWYSDPTAGFRFSTATGRLEYGHLGLGLSTRNGSEDVPLFFAGARPHEGETPAGLRMLHVAESLLREYAPQVRIRGLVTDAGYDAAAVYTFCNERQWTPIIDSQRKLVADAEVPRMPDGCTPQCPGQIGYKLHQRTLDALTYRCPAVMNTRDPETGKHVWSYDSIKCPLGQMCSKAQQSQYLRLLTADNPRRNLPVPRNSSEWGQLMRTRTAGERLFSGLHQAIAHRTHRRAHLVEITGTMYWLNRQLRLVASRHRADLDAFWLQAQGRVEPAAA